MELEGLAGSLAELDRAGLLEESRAGKARIRAHLDSEYVIGGARGWIAGWRARGWVTKEGSPVANREIWERVAALLDRSGPIEWVSVRGHRGHPVNDRVDEIAVAFSKGVPIPLYRGGAEHYPVKAVLRWVESPEDAKLYPKPVYLSLVGGAIARHATWAACEGHVRGQKGARYKKVHSVLEERETLRAWGVPDDSGK